VGIVGEYAENLPDFLVLAGTFVFLLCSLYNAGKRMTRLVKQILYGAFYLSIFFGLLFGVFRAIFPSAPPDPYLAEIRALSPLVVLRTVFFINAAENTVDIGAEIRNPNLFWGVRRFDYSFVLKGAQGEELSRAAGRSFVLPGETRWVILPGGIRDLPIVPLPRDGVLNAVDLEIHPIAPTEWQKVRPFAEDVSIHTKNLRYELIRPPRVGFADLRGEVENRSSFLLDEVEVKGVIFGPRDSVLAIGRSVVMTVRPGEARAFTISWPNRFPGTAARWAAWGHANFLNDDTFVRQFRAPIEN
jgi:hypothetical protein